MAHYSPPITYEPTPAEIRAACLEIQKGWNATMRRSRGLWAYEQQHLRVVAYQLNGPLEVQEEYYIPETSGTHAD